MIKVKEKFFRDKNGKPVSVVLDIKEYRKMIKKIEELDAIRAYDVAKASKDEVISFDQAIREIERERQ